MSTNYRCEVCNAPHEIGTVEDGTLRYFCRPHALAFWERRGARKDRTCSYCGTAFSTFDPFANLCATCEQRAFICAYCDRPFAPPKSTTTICRQCYYDGKDKEPRFADLLDELRGLDGVKWAGIAHTGGGCWALEVTRADDHYLMATVAFKDDEHADGWSTDADIPETEDGPWCVGFYDNEGDAYAFPPGHHDDVLMPVDRQTLLACARGFVTPPTRPTIDACGCFIDTCATCDRATPHRVLTLDADRDGGLSQCTECGAEERFTGGGA